MQNKLKKSLKNHTGGLIVFLMLLANLGCLESGGSGANGNEGAPNESQTNTSEMDYKKSLQKLKINLETSADSHPDSLQHVFVKVKKLEALLVGGERGARISLTKPSQILDLLDASALDAFSLAELNLSSGVVVKELRLVLESSGNSLVKQDGSICQLQTPSAQQSGLKLKLSEGLTVEADKSYRLNIHFDVEKSIVFKGNGGCLLKPVLRIGSIQVNDEENQNDPTQPGDADNNEGHEDLPGTPANEEETEAGSEESIPPADDHSGSLPEEGPAGPVEGVDYIVLENQIILILQPDGSYFVVEGVDLTEISIEELIESVNSQSP